MSAVARDGYAQAKVGETAEIAGVSRATFYELFRDKRACFTAALSEYGPRMHAELSSAVHGAEENTARAAITALVTIAEREPDVFRCLTQHAIAAGDDAVREHDALLARMRETIDSAAAATPANREVPAIEAWPLLAGVIWTLNVHLRRGEQISQAFAEDLGAWSDLYLAPRSDADAAPGEAPGGLLELTDVSAVAPLAPPPLPRGRHRLPPDVVKRVQRERILYATASVVTERGYEDTTVADIVAAARLSREVFYQHLSDKRDALLEASRLYFGQAMSAAAAAYFTSGDDEWPEKMWRGGSAITGILGLSPNFAHLTFVDVRAADNAVSREIDDLFLGFSLFLEDGYRYRGGLGELPRTVAEAITGAISEMAAAKVREGRTGEITSLMPISTYLILAPFTGVEPAREFVEAKLKALGGAEHGSE